MNDYEVLATLSNVLEVPITSSKVPGPRTLPMGALRVQSARAYFLLQILEGNLVGLKGMEAKAALAFFPTSGTLKGRHTTDEFMLPVWKEFARSSLVAWNSRRRIKIGEGEIEARARSWVDGRIRRARKFVDSLKYQPTPNQSGQPF